MGRLEDSELVPPLGLIFHEPSLQLLHAQVIVGWVAGPKEIGNRFCWVRTRFDSSWLCVLLEAARIFEQILAMRMNAEPQSRWNLTIQVSPLFYIYNIYIIYIYNIYIERERESICYIII
jgi:hypothetical protein